MVTTVTDNSPQSINTSLFSLDKEVQEVKKTADALNNKLSGIDIETGVISVNGKQGIVELDASDVKALPDTTVIPTKTSELTNDSGFITSDGVGSSFVPVTRKVNNKQLNTDITLTASDVGALPNTTVIPTKTSELTNDSGFITSSGSITGNAATATTADKATKDASGNVITSTYLPLSGGEMTGNISYQGSKSTNEMIKFIDNKNDVYGNGVVIGGGGATIIGGGESSNVLKDTLTSGGDELMKIGNDDNVEIWTNLQDGIASGKKFTFGVDGNITTPLGTVALKSEVNDLIDDSKTDSAHTWSSEKISKSKVAFSSEEKEIGTWFGQKLYEKTVILDVPKNGDYIASIPSNEKIKDWRGNFFQGSIDNPSWIMHAPYTYIKDNVTWIMIYIYFVSGMIKFSLIGSGLYADAYFNGQLVLTYKYTKD